MKITYLTVCVDYVDYLAVAHKHNRGQFDDYVVVTSLHDTATQLFCEKHGLRVVATDAFYHNGAVFNKGAGLNVGLQFALDQDNDSRFPFEPLPPRDLDWVCIMDADTFVPIDFREQLEAASPLNKEFLYGCRRTLLPTWQDYQTFLGEKDGWSHLYTPSGFCFGWMQLINWQSTAIQSCVPGTWYPQSFDCTECDWKFMHRWGDLADEYTRGVGNVAELPFRVFNLGPDGVNHQTRKSIPFAAPNA